MAVGTSGYDVQSENWKSHMEGTDRKDVLNKILYTEVLNDLKEKEIQHWKSKAESYKSRREVSSS